MHVGMQFGSVDDNPIRETGRTAVTQITTHFNHSKHKGHLWIHNMLTPEAVELQQQKTRQAATSVGPEQQTEATFTRAHQNWTTEDLKNTSSFKRSKVL